MNEEKEPAADGPGTVHHESVTDLRREIAEDAQIHLESAHAYRASVLGHPRTPAECDAHASGLMAHSYGYTLAAVLGIAQREFGPHVTERLAVAADLILADGDFDGLNADVLPPRLTPQEQAVAQPAPKADL